MLQEKSGAKEAGKAAHSCHKDPEAGQSEGTVEFRVLGSLAACMFNMFNRGHLLSGLLSQLTRMGRICYRKSSYQVLFSLALQSSKLTHSRPLEATPKRASAMGFAGYFRSNSSTLIIPCWMPGFGVATGTGSTFRL